ncbi:MAG: YeeE/YedE family protein [Lysobacteraceae bacterium]|nr:YeeE/YedE family protein [Xanthomonadaceae bacterium]HRX99147.1 YeeE/YedE family protein [Xanthomonadaceae bacterium]
MRIWVALACGMLFGAGLTLSGMTDPAKVVGFLDVFGAWDPTLVVVMSSALLVTLPLFQLAARRSRPLLDRQFFLPVRTRVDRDLLLGSAIFGVGWGVAGFCPGPAIAGLVSGSTQILLFVLSMAVGMTLRSFSYRRQPGHFECKT